MSHCFVDDLCTFSVAADCDRKCGQEHHLPHNIPIFDGHIHLNQSISHRGSDFISVNVNPPIREFHFVNNKHKPDEWVSLDPYLPYSHVHVYPTLGIHPKYFNFPSISQTINDLEHHLHISNVSPSSNKKLVAVGECGLDITSAAPLNQQIFVFEKQIDLAVKFRLPLVLHCRGLPLYEVLYNCLKNRISDRQMPIHWHCINKDSDFNIVDRFLHEYPNSYIGLNGSLTYENNTKESLVFKSWLIHRSPLLLQRLVFETDYPYLAPRQLQGVYDPSCALIATATSLSKLIDDPNRNFLSYLHSSNVNIKSLYNL